MPSARRDRWLALALLLAVLGLAYLLLVHPGSPSRCVRSMPMSPPCANASRACRRSCSSSRRSNSAFALPARHCRRPGFLREARRSCRRCGRPAAGCGGDGQPGQPQLHHQQPHAADRQPARRRVRARRHAGALLRGGRTGHRAAQPETGSPRLFVDNLNLIAQRFQQSPNESGLGLDVSFELAGYLLPGAAADGTVPAPAATPAPSASPAEAAPAPQPAPRPKGRRWPMKRADQPAYRLPGAGRVGGRRLAGDRLRAGSQLPVR